MKIALSCHPTQGGSGVVATEIAEALARRGHEVHLVTWSRPFRLRTDSPVQFHQVNVPDYPLFQYPPLYLTLANKLAGVAKDYHIDVIHAHYAVPHSVTALLARDIIQPRQVRVVTTLHGTDITLVGSHKDFFDLIRYAMICSDGLTAVSKWLCQETMRRFALPLGPRHIPNFIDPKRFSPANRRGYPTGSEEFHLVHASNLRPVKRVTDIIRVFHLVQKELPARLTIWGDGPEKGMAQELVAELGIGERVCFAGISAAMPEALRGAHLCLLLSDYESFGLSALEAMACGTPVMASAAGGLPEVVADGEAGSLCPVGDIYCTSKRIIDLLRDRTSWEQMSAGAARIAREKFSVDPVISQYETLYQQVAGE